MEEKQVRIQIEDGQIMKQLINGFLNFIFQGIIIGLIFIFVIGILTAFHGCSSSTYNCNSKETYKYKKRMAPSMVYHKN